MSRRTGIVLLAAALAVVLLFDIIGALAPFISWGLALTGFLVLQKETTTKRAATPALVVLAGAVVISIVLTGLVLGVRGRQILHSPNFDSTPIAEVLGFVAAWLAVSVFLILVERPRRGRLAIASVAFLAAGGYAYASDELGRAGVIQPSFGLDGFALTATILASIALLIASLVRFARRPQTTANISTL